MTVTLSVRIDAGTKRKLEALATTSKRSKSFLASEAIAAYVESEDWQLGETQAGIDDANAERTVSHQRVSKWMRSWGEGGRGEGA